MRYTSTKTYGHEIGLSACFRQWRAESHCRFLHGYALSVKLEFGADQLDSNNWVVDFGGLKQLKSRLEAVFDHKLLVAYDDPMRSTFEALGLSGVADVQLVESTGCEAFAELIFLMTAGWLVECKYTPRVKLLCVEVKEHGANSATYRGLQ